MSTAVGIRINTPPNGTAFRAGATISMTGHTFRGGRAFPAHTLLFVVRDEAGRPINRSVEIRSSNIINLITGMFHFAFDAPPPTVGVAQKAVAVVFARFLVDGQFKDISAERKIVLHGANSTDRSSVAPSGPATGEFGIKVATVQPLGSAGPSFAAGEPFEVEGSTRIMDDDTYMHVVLYEKATNVVGDSMIAPNWMRANRKRFSGSLLAPSVPSVGVDIAHTLAAQVLSRNDGKVVDSSSIDIMVRASAP